MNQSQAFLDSIVKAPEDDTLRLVYADWLQENGQPERAEFVRLQVEAGRLPEGKARAKLEAKAKRVLDRRGPKWLAGTGLLPAVVRFRRGFPDALNFTVPWEREPEDGWDAVPEEGLLASLLSALRPWPELRLVRRLVLSGESVVGEEVVRVLADAPEYGRVTELVLIHLCLNPDDFVRLASSKTLTRLRVLSVPVSSNNDTDEVRDEGCAAIARSPNFAHLEVLELSRTEIGNKGAEALAKSPHLGNLQRLDLSFNEIGDVGARALAASSKLRSLKRLIFTGNRARGMAIRELEARFGDLSIHADEYDRPPE